MRTSLVLVTGVDPEAISATTMSLLCDLPGAVTVRHHIDPDAEMLVRVVSDVGGTLERAEIPLAHVCVTCAIREDVLPTLDRLAGQGRWTTIVAALPVGATADQVDHVLAWDPRLARRLRLLSVVTALDAAVVTADLLGPDTLRDRGRHSSPDDDRGIAEVACSMVERADVVVLAGDEAPSPDAEALVRTLARADALTVVGAEHLDAALLSRARHRHRRTAEHAAPTFAIRPPEPDGLVWQVELMSTRPFHPDRLLEDVETLAVGAHRSRGRFWVPTRSEQVLQWDGAGGHLSFAEHGRWGREAPATRLVLTGLGSAPLSVPCGFDQLLVTLDEARRESSAWDVLDDGLEPWLGPIRDVA